MSAAEWRPDDVAENEMRAVNVDLEKVWHGVCSGIWSTPTGKIERALSRVLESPAVARAVITTPSLLVAWVLASVAVFGVGAVASATVNQPVVALLAPAVAAVAVAFAYGAGADPAYEVVRTMAVPARMILLVRVSVVFATNAALGMVAMLLAPGVGNVTVTWLLPMTAISLVGLAVATLCQSATVGGAVAVSVWALLVLVSHGSFDAVLLKHSHVGWLALYLALTAIALPVVWWTSGDGNRRREMAGWL